MPWPAAGAGVCTRKGAAARRASTHDTRHALVQGCRGALHGQRLFAPGGVMPKRRMAASREAW